MTDSIKLTIELEKPWVENIVQTRIGELIELLDDANKTIKTNPSESFIKINSITQQLKEINQTIEKLIEPIVLES